MTLRQNVHIGICKGAAMEKAIWEGQTKHWSLKQSTLINNGKLANQIAKIVATVVKINIPYAILSRFLKKFKSFVVVSPCFACF